MNYIYYDNSGNVEFVSIFKVESDLNCLEFEDSITFYKPKVINGELVEGATDAEIELRDWEGGDLAVQVIAPIEMILTDFGVKMKGWFELLGLPILPKGNKVHLYCNKIDDQFKPTVDQLVLDGVLTIKEKPQN